MSIHYSSLQENRIKDCTTMTSAIHKQRLYVNCFLGQEKPIQIGVFPIQNLHHQSPPLVWEWQRFFIDAMSFRFRFRISKGEGRSFFIWWWWKGLKFQKRLLARVSSSYVVYTCVIFSHVCDFLKFTVHCKGGAKLGRSWKAFFKSGSSAS